MTVGVAFFTLSTDWNRSVFLEHFLVTCPSVPQRPQIGCPDAAQRRIRSLFCLSDLLEDRWLWWFCSELTSTGVGPSKVIACGRGAKK